jgi:hypothetical protein
VTSINDAPPAGEPAAAAPALAGNNQGKRGGKFTKGQSGNPRGRRPGSRSRAAMWLDSLTPENHRAICAKLTGLALKGDRVVLRLYVERTDPLRKGRPVTIKLPAVRNTSDVLAALEAISASVAAGDLTPDEALQLSAIVDRQRATIEQVELETRVARIEAKLPKEGHRD